MKRLYTMTTAGPLVSWPVLLGNRMPMPVPPNAVLSSNQVEHLEGVNPCPQSWSIKEGRGNMDSTCEELVPKPGWRGWKNARVAAEFPANTTTYIPD